MNKRTVRLTYKAAGPLMLVWLVFVFLDRYAWDETYWIPIFIVGALFLAFLVLLLLIGPSKETYVHVDPRGLPIPEPRADTPPDSTTYGKETSP